MGQKVELSYERPTMVRYRHGAQADTESGAALAAAIEAETDYAAVPIGSNPNASKLLVSVRNAGAAASSTDSLVVKPMVIDTGGNIWYLPSQTLVLTNEYATGAYESDITPFELYGLHGSADVRQRETARLHLRLTNFSGVNSATVYVGLV